MLFYRVIPYQCIIGGFYFLIVGSQPNRDMFMQKISFSELFDKSYYKFKRNKVWGYYGIMGEPTLVVSDMQIFKDIMIKVRRVLPILRKYLLSFWSIII